MADQDDIVRLQIDEEPKRNPELILFPLQGMTDAIRLPDATVPLKRGPANHYVTPTPSGGAEMPLIFHIGSNSLL